MIQKYHPLRSGALAAAALLCSLTLPPGTARAGTPVSTLQYLSGTQVPGQLPGVVFKTFSIPAINDPVNMGDTGTIAFRTKFGDASSASADRHGIFVGTGILVDTLTTAVNFNGATLATTYSTFQPPAINKGGYVAFHTRLSTDAGIWSALYTNLGSTTLRLMARVNHAAPGIPNEVIGSLTQFALTDDAIFFTAKLKTSVNVNAFNDEALWVWRPTLPAPVLVLREGLPLAVSRFRALLPATSSRGHGRSTSGNFVAAEWALTPTYHAALVCDTTTAGANTPGLYGYLIPWQTQPPFGLVTGASLGLPAVNSSGNVAVKTPLVSSTGINRAIVTGNPAASPFYSGLIAGTPSPAIPPFPMCNFTGIEPPVSNAAGDVATLVMAGPPTTMLNNRAVLYKPNSSAPLTSVARLNEVAPHLSAPPLGRFKSFADFALPDGAGPLFRAFTRTPNRQGIWVQDSAGTVQVLVHTGPNGNGSSQVPYQPQPKIVLSFALLSTVPGSSDQRRSFNASQQVAYYAVFTDQTTGIVTVQY